MLYDLEEIMTNNIRMYTTMYHFDRIYLVSDSAEKSWRKEFTDTYKGKRKKDTNIDWDFVYTTYSKVKESFKSHKRYVVLEAPRVEGDDWISFLVKLNNRDGKSNVIITNDYDIKQLLDFNTEPLYLNLMINEMYNSEKLFLPKNYTIFANKINTAPNDDLFDVNDDIEYLRFIETLISKYTLYIVDKDEELFVKLVSGDAADNISSIWYTINEKKQKRGIGETGAKKIYTMYIEEYGNPDFSDPDFSTKVSDVVCLYKKLSVAKESKVIAERLERNTKLISLALKNFPKEILSSIKETYKESIL